MQNKLIKIMENIKKNFGLVILSISIIISSAIITESITNTYKNMSYGKFNDGIPLRVEHQMLENFGRVSLGVNTNSNDVTYNSDLKIGEGENFYIKTAPNNKLTIITGKNIIARFYHIGNLLTLEYETEQGKFLKFFNNPTEWGNKLK